MSISLFIILLFITPMITTATPIDPGDATSNWTTDHAPNSGFMPTTSWGPITHGGVGLPPGVFSVIRNSPVGPQNMTGSLISDFVVAGDFHFSGYLRAMSGPVDAGSFGIVFGWQNYTNTYYLEWSGSCTGCLPQRPSALKITKTENVITTVMEYTMAEWIEAEWYLFDVERMNNEISILIASMDSNTEILSTNIMDTAFMSGHIGLWGINQFGEWGGMDIETAAIPEPATMLLFGSGIIGLAGFRKKFMIRPRS